jgi:hypothetical protein
VQKEGTQNEITKQTVGLKEAVKKERKIRYGHVRRMGGGERVHRAALDWMQQKGGRGKARIDNIGKAMNGSKRQDEHCQDRIRWREGEHGDRA